MHLNQLDPPFPRPCFGTKLHVRSGMSKTEPGFSGSTYCNKVKTCTDTTSCIPLHGWSGPSKLGSWIVCALRVQGCSRHGFHGSLWKRAESSCIEQRWIARPYSKPEQSMADRLVFGGVTRESGKGSVESLRQVHSISGWWVAMTFIRLHRIVSSSGGHVRAHVFRRGIALVSSPLASTK